MSTKGLIVDYRIFPVKLEPNNEGKRCHSSGFYLRKLRGDFRLDGRLNEGKTEEISLREPLGLTPRVEKGLKRHFSNFIQ